MSLFKLFSNKNPNFLKDDEKEAAKLLQNIVIGNLNGRVIPDGIAKLTIGIYHIAFNRTNKDTVSLQTLKNSAVVANNPEFSKYLAILKIIRLTLERFIGSEKAKAEHKNVSFFENFMLQIIQSSVEKINSV